MNIDKIRKDILKKRGNSFAFKFKGARNQIDEFIGRIVGVYQSVFTIEVMGKVKRIKSFSYNDILIHNLEIKEVAIKQL